MTHKLALLGWPLGHSLSPQVHRELLTLSGIEAEYSMMPVPNLDALRRELDALRSYSVKHAASVVAANVTLPFKRAVVTEADYIDDVVHIGCANLLHFVGGRVYAYNTDGFGFERAASTHESDSWVRVLVLGAGGCAQAVVDTLLHVNFDVRVCSRQKPPWIDTLWFPFSDGSNVLASWSPHLWVQATSASVLGTEQDLIEQLETWKFTGTASFAGLERAAYAFETNYAPTLWQQWAASRGLSVLPHAGLDMLILQAIATHRIVFRLSPETTALMHASLPLIRRRLLQR